nr:hypothetical protein CFP56_65245 [Quercus suber]
MSTFQALLLAASLGCSTVAAVGVAHTAAAAAGPPLYPYPNYNYTLSRQSISTFVLSTTYPHATGPGTYNAPHLESSDTSLDLPTWLYPSPELKTTQTSHSISLPTIAYSPGTKSTHSDLGFVTPSLTYGGDTITATPTATFVPTSSFVAVPVQDSNIPDYPQSTLVINPYGSDAPSAKPTTVTVNGVPVAAGSTEVVISGTRYSLAPSGHAIYVNGASADLPAADHTDDGSSAFQIEGTPVAAGSPAVTIHGVTYSLAPSGDVLNVDGAEVDLWTSEQSSSSSSPDVYDVDGTRVAAGSSAVEVQGTTYSLAPSGDAIYVNGASISIPTQSGTSGQDDWGAAVMSVIGGTRGASTIEITIPASGTASASTLDLIAAASSSTTTSTSSTPSSESDNPDTSDEPFVSSSPSLSIMPGLALSLVLLTLILL